MPRASKLNWDPRRGEWVSVYRGKKKRFAGGRGKSDRDAYQNAKHEWKKWRALVDLESDNVDVFDSPLGYPECLDGWECVKEHARFVGDEELLNSAQDRIDDLMTQLRDPNKARALTPSDFHPATLPQDQHNEDGYFEYAFRYAATPEEARAKDYLWRQQLASAKVRLQSGRTTETAGGVSPAEVSEKASLSNNIEKFLLQKRRQVETGDLAATRADMLRRHSDFILEHFDHEFDVTSIDGQSLIDFRHFLLKAAHQGRFSRSMAKDVFAAFKQLIRWMFSTAETIDRLPRNFADKSLAIHVELGEPRTLNVDAIRDLIQDSSDRTKLYICLGLNCGYRQTDIASIKPEEVDWKLGTITRKRTKTAKHPNTPKVTYKLWPETLSLLRQERSDSPERVLLSANGTPLVVSELNEDGGYKKLDAIKSAMQRVGRRKDYPVSMDVLRNTSATCLKGSPTYTSVTKLFLGQAPRDMDDKHYAVAPMALLAEATDWLREQIQIENIFISED